MTFALLAPEDRPRERLARHGPAALTSAELIALVLGTGRSGASALEVAAELLAESGGLGPLTRAVPAELAAVGGIGAARAGRLAAAFELGRRALFDAAPIERLAGPADVAARLRPRLSGLKQEVFIVLGLDARQRVIEEREVSRGVLDGTAVHPREVFRPLIRCAAHAGVIVHNHPSGDPTPSAEDLAVTRRLFAVGELVGIPLVDHVVVADGDYTSIAELDPSLGAP